MGSYCSGSGTSSVAPGVDEDEMEPLREDCAAQRCSLSVLRAKVPPHEATELTHDVYVAAVARGAAGRIPLDNGD